MHRIWRVVLVSVVCLMLAWPSLGLAYIDRDRVVDAHPIGHVTGTSSDGTSEESDTIAETEAYDGQTAEQTTSPEVLTISIFWHGVIYIPLDGF